MGKLFNTADKNNSVKSETFVDKTNENWYVNKKSNKIAFGNSIDDIIEGNAKFVDFIHKDISVRMDKNRKEEDVERNNYILFTLSDESKVLVRSRDELK